jgi:hypothetical protein
VDENPSIAIVILFKVVLLKVVKPNRLVFPAKVYLE